MRHLIVLISCLLYGTVVSGQSTGRMGKDHALFFAVEDYEYMSALTNPIENAEAIAEELKTRYGFRTEVVRNPTFGEIAAKIMAYQQRFSSGAYDPKGQLLIFFSGHGIQRGNNGYFIPKDGNPAKVYEKVIEYDNWRYEIDQINCQHILVIVDACYSLTFDPNWRNKTDRDFGRRGERNKDQVLLDYDRYRARLFFTSDGTNNQTPDRSTLARQFLTGLRTYRSANSYLPADELYARYLKRADPVPGGGDFGRDDPGSRFLFFSVQRSVSDDTKNDLSAWREAQSKGDCAAYRTYLSVFPYGDFAVVAREKTDSCDQEQRMLVAWENAKTSDDCAGYNTFVSEYPVNPYRETIRRKLNTLRCDNSEAVIQERKREAAEVARRQAAAAAAWKRQEQEAQQRKEAEALQRAEVDQNEREQKANELIDYFRGGTNGLESRRTISSPGVQGKAGIYGLLEIRICVDPEGKVISAAYSEEGSNISDSVLVARAVNNAKKWRFLRDPTAPEQQCGKITFTFSPSP